MENRGYQPPIRIALDFSTLDHLKPAGQYRYCVNLIRGLSILNAGMEFLVLGSREVPPSDIAEIFHDSRSNWRYLRFSHAIGRGSYWRDQIKCSLLVLRERIGLYHGLHENVPLLAPCLSIVTIYDLMVELFPEYTEWKHNRVYRLNKWLVRRVPRRIIAISESTAKDLRKFWKVDPSRIDVIPLGSEFIEPPILTSRDARRSSASAPSGPVILSPYNLEPRKNLKSLLDAISILIGQYPSLRLMLFGRAAVTSERENEFERLIADLKLSAVVERTGVLDDTSLIHLYRECTLFVFPSLYEGFGLPVLEAMASGACIIARNASAMAETVGDAGVLTETRDAGRLAATIRELLEDPLKRESLGTAALAKARSFTIARMAERTFKSYRAALG
jgi:glycosyltransferase involved in cell wall biosynthesis